MPETKAKVGWTARPEKPVEDRRVRRDVLILHVDLQRQCAIPEKNIRKPLKEYLGKKDQRRVKFFSYLQKIPN